MNVRNSDFAHQTMRSYVFAVFLEAHLAGPFRDQITCSLQGDSDAGGGKLAFLIARSEPAIVDEAVKHFNDSQDAVNNYLWQAKFDRGQQRLVFNREPVKCFGSGCSCC